MSNVLDFCAAKAKQNNQMTTSVDARGVVFYQLVVTAILLLKQQHQQGNLPQLFHTYRSIPRSAALQNPANFFVRPPDAIEHVTVFKCSIINTVSMATLVSATIDSFFRKELMEILTMYGFSASTEPPNGNTLVIVFDGSREAHQFAVVMELDPEQSTLQYQIKMWVPKSKDGFGNIDQLYAIDILDTMDKLISANLPSHAL